MCNKVNALICFFYMHFIHMWLFSVLLENLKLLMCSKTPKYQRRTDRDLFLLHTHVLKTITELSSLTYLGCHIAQVLRTNCTFLHKNTFFPQFRFPLHFSTWVIFSLNTVVTNASQSVVFNWYRWKNYWLLCTMIGF